MLNQTAASQASTRPGVLVGVRRGARMLVLLALVAVVLVGGRTARAQFGEAAGIAKLMRPEYTRADLRIFTEGLDLDDTQQLLVESLFDDYRTEFEAGWLGVQEELGSLKDRLDASPGISPDEIRAMVFEPFETWKDERDRLGRELMENIKVFLHDQQLARWDEFQMQLVRDKTLPAGEFSGEQVNLFYVLRDMRLPAGAEQIIQPVLSEFARELHGALTYRNDLIARTEGEMLASLGGGDTSVQLDLMKQQIEARVRVRDLNDLYRERIAEALPEEYADSFRWNALVKAYPRVFRVSSIEQMFDSAFELELEPKVREQLESLYTAYRTELDSANAELLSTIRDHEPGAAANRAELYVARLSGEKVAKTYDPVPAMLRRRDGVNSTYIERLRALLGNELFAELPGADRWIRKQERAEAREQAAKERAERERQRMEEMRDRKMDDNGSSMRDRKGRPGVGASGGNGGSR